MSQYQRHLYADIAPAHVSGAVEELVSLERAEALRRAAHHELKMTHIIVQARRKESLGALKAWAAYTSSALQERCVRCACVLQARVRRLVRRRQVTSVAALCIQAPARRLLVLMREHQRGESLARLLQKQLQAMLRRRSASSRYACAWAAGTLLQSCVRGIGARRVRRMMEGDRLARREAAACCVQACARRSRPQEHYTLARSASSRLSAVAKSAVRRCWYEASWRERAKAVAGQRPGSDVRWLKMNARVACEWRKLNAHFRNQTSDFHAGTDEILAQRLEDVRLERRREREREKELAEQSRAKVSEELRAELARQTERQRVQQLQAKLAREKELDEQELAALQLGVQQGLREQELLIARRGELLAEKEAALVCSRLETEIEAVAGRLKKTKKALLEVVALRQSRGNGAEVEAQEAALTQQLQVHKGSLLALSLSSEGCLPACLCARACVRARASVSVCLLA